MKAAKIKLDKQRLFIYNLKALRELEIALGEPLFTVFADAKKMASIDVMCKFIWAGMLEHEELTLDEAIEIIPLMGIADIMAQCGDLLGSAMQGEVQKKTQPGKVRAS